MTRAWVVPLLAWCALSACEKPCKPGYGKVGLKCVMRPVPDAGGAADASEGEGPPGPTDEAGRPINNGGSDGGNHGGPPDAGSPIGPECMDDAGCSACPAAGYELNAAGTECDDINECAEVSRCGQASGFGACNNTPGSYECICNQGRTGLLCEVVDQCGAPNVCTTEYPCVEESAPKVYRCAGQFPEWQLTDPPNRFSVTDGMVSDAKTGLEWQQTADPGDYTWEEAKQHCAGLGASWRLPKVTELLTIVNYELSDGAIDLTAFPNTPRSLFWTASLTVGHAGGVWAVDFNQGDSQACPMDVNDGSFVACSGDGHSSERLRVRCLR